MAGADRPLILRPTCPISWTQPHGGTAWDQGHRKLVCGGWGCPSEQQCLCGWKGRIPGRDEEGPLLECVSTDATCPGDDFCPEQGHLCREGAAQQQPSSGVVAGAGCALGIVRHMQSV